MKKYNISKAYDCRNAHEKLINKKLKKLEGDSDEYYTPKYTVECILDVLNPKYNFDNIIINPLGEWSGGVNVDSGATNRKLGSDMGRSVSGGGLHGKDLSKGDVTLNIYAFLKAQELNEEVKLCCAIGDKQIDGKSYSEIVDLAYSYIKSIGGFEKFAEKGLIR